MQTYEKFYDQNPWECQHHHEIRSSRSTPREGGRPEATSNPVTRPAHGALWLPICKLVIMADSSCTFQAPWRHMSSISYSFLLQEGVTFLPLCPLEAPEAPRLYPVSSTGARPGGAMMVFRTVHLFSSPCSVVKDVNREGGRRIPDEEYMCEAPGFTDDSS